MYEQNTSMVAANEQNKFLLPAMVEGDFSRDEIAEDPDSADHSVSGLQRLYLLL